MTRYEIVKETINNKDSMIIPYHVSFLNVMTEKIKDYLKTDDIDAAIGNYIKWLGINVPFTKLADNLERDAFGVIWKTNPYNRGNVAESPLKEPSIKNLQMPDYCYSTIFKDLQQQLAKDKDYYNIIWAGDLFERAHMLRGMEELFMDFYYNKEFLIELLEILTETIIKNIRAVKDLDIPGVFLSDDYGWQNGLLISRSMWKEFIEPCLKKIVDCAHACEKAFFLHPDGDVTELIPDLIEIGVDVLHPVQSEVMDFKGLKQTYGKDICFYGGIGTQSTMLTCSPEAVKKEVRSLISLENSSNGFILAPTLQLLEDIPFENVLALIEELQNV